MRQPEGLSRPLGTSQGGSAALFLYGCCCLAAAATAPNSGWGSGCASLGTHRQFVLDRFPVALAPSTRSLVPKLRRASTISARTRARPTAAPSGRSGPAGCLRSVRCSAGKLRVVKAAHCGSLLCPTCLSSGSPQGRLYQLWAGARQHVGPQRCERGLVRVRKSKASERR
jgi:hypothetical protein